MTYTWTPDGYLFVDGAQQAQIVTQQGGAAAPKAPVTVKLAVKTARPAYLAPRARGAPPPPPDPRAPRP